MSCHCRCNTFTIREIHICIPESEFELQKKIVIFKTVSHFHIENLPKNLLLRREPNQVPSLGLVWFGSYFIYENFSNSKDLLVPCNANSIEFNAIQSIMFMFSLFLDFYSNKKIMIIIIIIIENRKLKTELFKKHFSTLE